MKKRIVTICLVVALLATCFAGTYAYLTDKDAATNVMTLGNVYIDQIEEERDANGNLVPFTQAKPAYPVVGDIAWAADPITVGGGTQKVFHEDLKNVVDKFVYVKNTGKSDAYVRTIIAVEAPGYDKEDWIHLNVNASEGVSMSALNTVEINGVEYVYAVFTYTDALAPNAKTPVSLAQVFLDSKATNEYCNAFGDTWEILTLSQAVQSAGFADAATALDEAFGAADADAVAEWFMGFGAVVAAPESGATRPAGYNPVEKGTNNVVGITVIDNSDENTNLRALYTGDGKKVNGTLTVTDCYLDGTYAMNVIGDDTGDLIVSDTALRGWVSYDGFVNASFTNCTFAFNSNAELYNNVRPYSSVTFTRCDFDGTTFWLDMLPDGATVTFVDCTMDGVAITAADQITVTEGTAGAVIVK